MRYSKCNIFVDRTQQKSLQILTKQLSDLFVNCKLLKFKSNAISNTKCKQTLKILSTFWNN